MNINEIYGLMDRFEASSLSEMELEIEGIKLNMKKGGAVPMMTALAGEPFYMNASNQTPLTKGTAKASDGQVNNAVAEGDKEVVAPLVGTFYRAPAPGETPFVEVGTQVKKGDVIGIIEAMKLMNEITSTEDGIVTAIEAEDGAMVEYNQTLIRMK